MFHNETNNNNHWIKVRLEGVESNKDAFGSKVLVYTENEAFSLSLVSGQGYFSSHAKELYFGLGREKHIEKIEVRWPSGVNQSFENISTKLIISKVELFIFHEEEEKENRAIFSLSYILDDVTIENLSGYFFKHS